MELSQGTLPNKCQGAKVNAARKKAACVLGLDAKLVGNGTPVDAASLAKCHAKVGAGYRKLEAGGGCSTTGDATAIENKVDAFVNDVTSELPSPTSTTTTAITTSSCPQATAFYCGGSCGGGSPLCDPSDPSIARCPAGMTCTVTGSTCGCTGATIPRSDPRLSGLTCSFCVWGTCPPGKTCGGVPKSGACGYDCACQ